MHDTTWFEIQGMPAVFIASTEFVTAADAQSKALGLPDVKRIFVPHPIQDLALIHISEPTRPY